MKVYYLTNAPTPYKKDFWKNLGKECNLTVLLEVDNSRDRDGSWKSDNQKNYEEVILPHLFRRTSDAFCPCISQYLKKQDGLVIINGYNTPTGIYAILYSKRHKLPYVISCDGGLKKKDYLLTKAAKKLLLSGATGYLSSGAVTDEYLIHYGADRAKICRYPFSSIKSNQVLDRPPSSEEKTDMRRKLGIAERQMVVSVGQFIYRKGFDILLKAAEGLGKDIGVVIIGGTPTEDYQNIVEKSGLTNVHFLPFIQPEQLKEYYLAADLFVLPTREDIWGLVVNEAMACGLPVITTTRCVSGMEMIRQEDTGILIEPDNVVALRRAMVQLLSNPDSIQTKAENALKRAKEYTIEQMAECHMSYLENNYNRG